MNAPESILDQARTQLTFARPYYAKALYRLKLLVRNDVPSMHTDVHGRVYASPGWLTRNGVQVAATGLLHELHHQLRDHHGRARDLGVVTSNAALFNDAADCEINPQLCDDCVQHKPTMALLPEEWCLMPQQFDLPPYRTAEWYYAQRMSERAEQSAGEEQLDGGAGNGGSGRSGIGENEFGCGSGATGVRAPWEEGAPEKSDVEGLTESELWQLRVDTAREVIEYQTRGSIPGDVLAWAVDMLRAKPVPWDRLFAAAFRRATQTVAGTTQTSYARLSRRQSISKQIILPAYRHPVPSVTIVRDTSLSMVNGLALVCGLTEQLCRTSAAPLRVLDVDAKVQNERFATHGRLVASGLGGTDMRVGIERAFARGARRSDVAVICTDCDTPWPDAKPAGLVIVAAIGASPENVARVPSWARVVVVEAAS